MHISDVLRISVCTYIIIMQILGNMISNVIMEGGTVRESIWRTSNMTNIFMRMSSRRVTFLFVFTTDGHHLGTTVSLLESGCHFFCMMVLQQ
jgi:hypothetical protein